MPKIIYRWKGKIVTKKTYDKRLAQSKSGKLRRKLTTNDDVPASSTETNVKLESDIEEKSEKIVNYIVDGPRIVDLQFLGQQLWCVSCKEVLSLEHIENESRRGLGSQLSIRCHTCLIVNQVTTSKQHASCDKRSIRFHINYAAILGALHSGLGFTDLKKMFSIMNIPCFDYNTFKMYEHELGLATATENVAKNESKTCSKGATGLEKNIEPNI